MTSASMQRCPSAPAVAEPVEDRQVVVVDAELALAPAALLVAPPPRVLGRGVEGGAGQVEPGRAAVGVDPLGLEPGQQPQGLGVALEPADVLRRSRRGRARRCGRTAGARGRGRGRPSRRRRRCSPSACAELAADLGDLEAVREPVADEVVVAGLHDLGLGRQPAQRRRVDQPGPVAGEVVAVGPLGGRVLAHPALPVDSSCMPRRRAYGRAARAASARPLHPLRLRCRSAGSGSAARPRCPRAAGPSACRGWPPAWPSSPSARRASGRSRWPPPRRRWRPRRRPAARHTPAAARRSPGFS